MTAALAPQKTFAYPRSFDGLRPLKEQIRSLASAATRLGFDIDIRPALATADRAEKAQCSDRAEGWAAILSPALVGTYRQERELAIELLGLSSPSEIDVRFQGDEFLEEDLFQRDPFTAEAMDQLCERQGQSDILVLPVQLGQRYAEVSDAVAMQSFGPATGEFGLSILAGASLLATHPQRLAEFAHLGISLPGDAYDYHHDGSYTRLCMVKMLQQRITVMHFRKHAEWMRDHGAASGFLWE